MRDAHSCAVGQAHPTRTPRLSSLCLYKRANGIASQHLGIQPAPGRRLQRNCALRSICPDAAPREFSNSTQYVLCADGTFLLRLQSGRWGESEYLGKYSSSDSTVTFDFAASNLAGAWNAVGKLRGDTMTVVYNDVMVMANCIGGPYLRQAVP